MMQKAAILTKMIKNGLKAPDLSRPLLFEESVFPGDLEQQTVASTDCSLDPDVLTDILPETIASLTHFIEESESDFMLLGIGLRSVHSNVSELTDLMLGTVKQVTAEEEGGFLEQGKHILKASLAEIRDYHDGVKADLERINTVMTDLESLSSTSKQIKQFARSLKTVAMIMLVENGRIIDSSVNIFSEVAREIKELSVSITDIANDVYRHVEKARAIHRASREEISARIKRLETLTSEIETTVQQSAYDTEMLLQLSVDTVERAGRRSQDISRQVAEIVVGVQFHDSMKQRINHIISILQTIAASGQPAIETGTTNDIGSKAPADQVVREQADLLNEINSELNEVFQKNRSALKRIETEVSSLLTGLEDMGAGDRNEESIVKMQDPFFHLQDTLTQLHGLLDRGKILYEQIQKTAERVSGITAGLSQQLTVVQGISSHTHNKAINSIIAADRQGEKAGAMKLLAQEMNSLASQSDIFTHEVEGIITSIVNQAEDIGRQDMRGTPDRDNTGGAITRLDEVLNDISLAYESFRKDSLAALERAGGLKKAIDATCTGLDFFKGLSEKIDEYCGQLTTVAEQPGLNELMVTTDFPGADHFPDKQAADRQDNIILFEPARKNIAGSIDNEVFDHALGDNVELF